MTDMGAPGMSHNAPNSDMAGMEHAIEKAARIEADRKSRDEYWCGDPAVFTAGAEWAVDHLRECGLLAPTPLTEEWGTRFPEAGGTVVNGWNAHYPFFFKGGPPRGENVVRLVSDWLPADRAEGDGRAQS